MRKLTITCTHKANMGQWGFMLDDKPIGTPVKKVGDSFDVWIDNEMHAVACIQFSAFGTATKGAKPDVVIIPEGNLSYEIRAAHHVGMWKTTVQMDVIPVH